MPKLGITMAEGTVSRWLVGEGAAVEAGDPILTVETDKAEVEVTANEAGVLTQILVAEGATVPVGTPIAVFAVAGAGAESPAAPAAEPDGPTADQTPEPAAPEDRQDADAGQAAPTAGPGVAAVDDRRRDRPKQRISPLARRIAREHGIDLTGVVGTGPLDRIIARDVRALIEKGVGRGGSPADARATSAPPAPAPAVSPTTPGRREPLSRMRRIIAERMTYSTQTIPTFRLTAAADVTATAELRGSLVNLVERSGVRLTLTDFLVQAVAQALAEVPEANAGFVPGSGWDDSYIHYPDQINVGLAVAVDGGLIVPTIADADELSLIDIARRRTELIERARQGALLPGDLEGGTFTISNLGAFGVDQFDAIINPPQAAILAVGRARSENVLASDGTVETRTVMNLTVTCDHRVLDGAQGAAFLSAVVERLARADRYVLV